MTVPITFTPPLRLRAFACSGRHATRRNKSIDQAKAEVGSKGRALIKTMFPRAHLHCVIRHKRLPRRPLYVWSFNKPREPASRQETDMHILRIALLSSAFLVSPAAFAEGPEGHTPAQIAQAAPEGQTQAQVAQAAPEGQSQAQVAQAAPEGHTQAQVAQAAPEGHSPAQVAQAAPEGHTQAQ